MNDFGAIILFAVILGWGGVNIWGGIQMIRKKRYIGIGREPGSGRWGMPEVIEGRGVVLNGITMVVSGCVIALASIPFLIVIIYNSIQAR